jgi:hypothetical protein
LEYRDAGWEFRNEERGIKELTILSLISLSHYPSLPSHYSLFSVSQHSLVFIIPV